MNILVTDAARKQLAQILQDEGQTEIRFGLRGGGCSGFSYYFSFESRVEDDLTVVELGNGSLIVDPMSAMYLDGAEIDYKKDIMGETFVFSNPNTKTQCGCGNSVGF